MTIDEQLIFLFRSLTIAGMLVGIKTATHYKPGVLHHAFGWLTLITAAVSLYKEWIRGA